MRILIIFVVSFLLSGLVIGDSVAVAEDAISKNFEAYWAESHAKIQEDLRKTTDQEINLNLRIIEAGEEGCDASMDSCTASQKAVGTCTLGLTPEQKMMMQYTAQQSQALMAQGGTEGTCKAAKALSAALGGANVYHAQACQGAIKACKTAVDKDIKENCNVKKGAEQTECQKTVNRARERCSQLEGNVVGAYLAALQNLTGLLTSGKCQKEVASIPTPGGPQAMDCTNPTMASSPSCVCAVNPRDPICSALDSGAGGGSWAGASNPGDPGIFGNEPLDDAGFGYDDDIEKLAASNSGAPSIGGGGGGSGGMPGSGGAGGLPPEEMGGGGAGPYNTDIMSGLTGGSGDGGGGYAGGGGGSGSAGGGGLLDSLADKFNLKAFLPNKADFKNRGLAGMAGSGADGITGPNGPSLFEKVTTRYRKEQPKLMP